MAAATAASHSLSGSGRCSTTHRRMNALDSSRSVVSGDQDQRPQRPPPRYVLSEIGHVEGPGTQRGQQVVGGVGIGLVHLVQQHDRSPAGCGLRSRKVRRGAGRVKSPPQDPWPHVRLGTIDRQLSLGIAKPLELRRRSSTDPGLESAMR